VTVASENVANTTRVKHVGGTMLDDVMVGSSSSRVEVKIDARPTPANNAETPTEVPLRAYRARLRKAVDHCCVSQLCKSTTFVIPHCYEFWRCSLLHSDAKNMDCILNSKKKLQWLIARSHAMSPQIKQKI
jgi:hypothetical protein